MRVGIEVYNKGSMLGVLCKSEVKEGVEKLIVKKLKKRKMCGRYKGLIVYRKERIGIYIEGEGIIEAKGEGVEGSEVEVEIYKIEGLEEKTKIVICRKE
jgi:hypothetical protein